MFVHLKEVCHRYVAGAREQFIDSNQSIKSIFGLVPVWLSRVSSLSAPKPSEQGNHREDSGGLQSGSYDYRWYAS